jgi:hypothetical protein
VVAAALLSSNSPSGFAQVPDAASVVARAHEALGGASRLAAVKTFTATGRTKQLRGNNLVPIEFEINCELPARFVRRDEIPAQDTDPTTTGFDGDQLIIFPPMPVPPARAGGDAQTGRGGPGADPTQQRLLQVKQDFARLMLGAFVGSFSSYPLTMKYVGQAEAPEGTADVLDYSGPAGFSARLVVQRSTHLPVMLIWQAMQQGKPAELRLYYGDYRDVDGVKWPFRLRRAIASETVEETTFDRVRINLKIDPRKFDAPR